MTTAWKDLSAPDLNSGRAIGIAASGTPYVIGSLRDAKTRNYYRLHHLQQPL